MGTGCEAKVLVKDDRWGGFVRGCELPARHGGKHSASLGACDPVALMRWEGTYVEPPPPPPREPCDCLHGKASHSIRTMQECMVPGCGCPTYRPERVSGS